MQKSVSSGKKQRACFDDLAFSYANSFSLKFKDIPEFLTNATLEKTCSAPGCWSTFPFFIHAQWDVLLARLRESSQRNATLGKMCSAFSCWSIFSFLFHAQWNVVCWFQRNATLRKTSSTFDC